MKNRVNDCFRYSGFVEIDECQSGAHDCDVNAYCTNTNGSYFCTCKNGFAGDGKSCIASKEKHDLNNNWLLKVAKVGSRQTFFLNN